MRLPALALLALLGSGAAGAQPLEVTVLSYNTHGLAGWIARDDPEARFPVIGELVNRYDVVLLQEDFEHHERLRARLRHPLVERGNPSRFPGWLCPLCRGSGLTLLARWRDALHSLTNAAYGVCSGWLGGANDCLATKGFQHARLRIPGGPVVDFVNTHLDAGRSREDRDVRRRQLAALRGYLEREAPGRPLVVAGDFNLDADVSEDAALRDGFAAGLGLADSGAGPAPGTPWKHLDYIYLRDGEGARLEILEAGEDPTFVREGLPLSDHPAIFTRLRIHEPE